MFSHIHGSPRGSVWKQHVDRLQRSVRCGPNRISGASVMVTPPLPQFTFFFFFFFCCLQSLAGRTLLLLRRRREGLALGDAVRAGGARSRADRSAAAAGAAAAVTVGVVFALQREGRDARVESVAVLAFHAERSPIDGTRLI